MSETLEAIKKLVAAGAGKGAGAEMFVLGAEYNGPGTIYSDLKPSGKYVMEDVHNAGGVPAVMKYLLENDLLNGDCLTVTGKTIAGNLKDVPGLKEGQKVIYPLEKPIKETGHLRILRDNLAPGGGSSMLLDC